MPRCTPEAQGIASSAILEFLDQIDAGQFELHSIMLLRRGQVVVEGWWLPFRPEDPHPLFSLSKSFTSTAVGLAIAEGLISIEDRVLSYFPEEKPSEVSPYLEAMRIRHLLTMSTGHAEDTFASLFQDPDGNWARAFLAQPVIEEPGARFVYNSGATYMLSAILQKVTGQTLLTYLQPRLFEPLGIQGAEWETCPQGICVGGWGLSLKTEDIARFGQLYLQKGIWRGRRLLSEEWVEAATSAQIAAGSNPESDWEQGYGYQFWRCRFGAYRADGAFGQFCVVMPVQEAVLVMTARVEDMQAVLDLVWKYLLPAMQPIPLPEAEACSRLKERLKNLAIQL